MSWKIVLRGIPELCVPNFTGALLTSLEHETALPDELWPLLCEQTRNFFVEQYGEVGNRSDYSKICDAVVSAFPIINRETFGELYPKYCNLKRKLQSQNRQVLPDQSDETPIPVTEPVIHPGETPKYIVGNDDQEYELTNYENNPEGFFPADEKNHSSDGVKSSEAAMLHNNDEKADSMDSIAVGGDKLENEAQLAGLDEDIDSWWEDSLNAIAIAEEIESFHAESISSSSDSSCYDLCNWDFDEQPNNFFYLEYVDERRKTRRTPQNYSKDLNLQKSRTIKFLDKQSDNTCEIKKLFLDTYDHRTALIRSVEYSTLVRYYPCFTKEEMLEAETITFLGLSNYKAMLANSRSFLAALQIFRRDLSAAKCVEDFFLTVNPIGNFITVFNCRSEYSKFEIESDQNYMYAAIFDSEDHSSNDSQLQTAEKLDVFNLKMFGLTFKFGAISTALVYVILIHSLLERKNYPDHHRTEFRALEAFLTGNRALVPPQSREFCLSIAKMFEDIDTIGSMSIDMDIE